MVETGQILGHYRIEQKVGEGAFGEVWRAVDIRLDRKVALKVMRGSVDEDAAAWGRLLQEARAASALNHPGICATFDIGEEEGVGYIAMEYVEGRPLSALISEAPLPPERAVEYGEEMAAALAHHRGIIHRDLKASNVMITSEDHAKLLDFGLARRMDAPTIESLSQSRQSMAELGGTAGTLCYMAPEILRGKPASPGSDLWSLGAVLYEMLSGRLPFQGQTPFELSMAILVEQPAPLAAGLPERLRSVVRKCLEKDPAQRPSDAGEVEVALEQSKAALAGTGRGRLTRLTGTRAGVASVIGLGLAVLAGLTWLGFAWWHRGADQRRNPAIITVVQTPPLQDQVLPSGGPSPQAPPASRASDGGADRGASQTADRTATPARKARGRAHQGGNPNTDVWVNLKSGVYHCPGTRWYKKTANGRLLKQRQAQLAGYHAASDKACE